MIQLKDKALWDKIQNFQLDNPEDKLTFTKRLARENGWTAEFASRVVGEYKKFIYLSVTSGKSLTPSDEVDQAWHLHLIYSQSYWIDFVRNTLGGHVLHHGPTKGGPKEGERFNVQYEDTLVLYREQFGREPVDIWPDAHERFTNINFRRVSTRDNVIVNKKRVLQYAATYVPFVMLILAGLLMSATTEKPEDGLAWGWWVLIIAVAIFIIRGLYRLSKQDRKYGSSSGSSSSSDNEGVIGAFFGCGSSGCGSSGCGSSCGGGGCGGGGCGGCGG